MSGSIRLHKEFGVNPSVDLCFWCGEAVGVALLGHNKGKEAPREIVTGYTPCDKCQANMAMGITIMEADEAHKHPGRPEIQAGVVPTGSWFVVSEEFMKSDRCPFDAESRDQMLKARKALMSSDVFQMMAPKDAPDDQN